MNDKELQYYALTGYANWLETGDFLLSGEDLLKLGKPIKKFPNNESMKMIVRLRELAVKVINV